jgi:GTPase SAR1 family protein
MEVENKPLINTKIEIEVKENMGGPQVLIVMGMAGSGKTTFVQYLIKFLNDAGKRTYNVNLDPAVLAVNFPCNIDIRDSVKYKQVMKQY